MPLIPFIFPINVYLIGDSLGAGLQFALVRIQETYLGWSIIPLWREIQFITSGLITGRTAISILLWLIGVGFLLAAAILLVSNRKYGRRGVTIYGIGCALLMVSTMVQYGPLFNGPAGVAIPIGLPLLIVIGYFLWKDANRPAREDDDDDLSEPDDASVPQRRSPQQPAPTRARTSKQPPRSVRRRSPGPFFLPATAPAWNKQHDDRHQDAGEEEARDDEGPRPLPARQREGQSA